MPPVDGMAGNFGKVLPATTVKSNLGAAAELGRKKQLMWWEDTAGGTSLVKLQTFCEGKLVS
jgi:hypothetical protein